MPVNIKLMKYIFGCKIFYSFFKIYICKLRLHQEATDILSRKIKQVLCFIMNPAFTKERFRQRRSIGSSYYQHSAWLKKTESRLYCFPRISHVFQVLVP